MHDLIHVEGLVAGYGAAVVLEDISFTMSQGDSLALLGRNGMGKTSLLSTLMGITRTHRGRLRFGERDIVQMPSYKRARAGLGWVPQEREIFSSLTVEENLTAVHRPGEWNLAKVYEVFPRLHERKANMGNQLSGGEQQMVAMARALMINPKLLLLDEPLEGLAPLIAQELLNVIRKMVHDSSMGVILVEQHAKQILPITRQALVLERGRSVYSGPSQTLLNRPEMLDQWLGVKAH